MLENKTFSSLPSGEAVSWARCALDPKVGNAIASHEALGLLTALGGNSTTGLVCFRGRESPSFKGRACGPME